MVTAYEYPMMLVAAVVAAVAAGTDVRSGRIPNLLTLPLLTLAPFVSLMLGGTSALVASGLGIVVAGVGPGILYVASGARGIGGGDVKLFLALGAVVGPTLGLEIELLSFVLVLVIAFGKLAYRGLLLRTLKNSLFIALNAFLPKGSRRPVAHELLEELRMGVPILLATLSVFALRHPEWWA